MRFTISCAEKTVTARRTPDPEIPFLITSQRENPIRRYRIVHAGPNSQFGGVNQGLLSVTYQLGIEDSVKIDPMKPTNKGKIRQPARRRREP